MTTLSKPPGCVHVVKMLGKIELSDSYVIVMECPISSLDLRQYCKDKGPLPESLALDIFKQVVVACQHCFNRRVYHNDINPDNLLINIETSLTKLIDFGCAIWIGPNKSEFRTDIGYNQRESSGTYFLSHDCSLILFLFRN